MPEHFDRFQRSLDLPLTARSRLLLALSAIALVVGLTQPLWTIGLHAPQYPAGLELQIYPYTVDGDVSEVNTLNHYIGMRRIDKTTLSELDWIPFGLGALILLALRVAGIGDLRSLVDLFVVFAYFSLFSMARFVYQLYVFGHELDPKAPFQVEPFTPAILGTASVANFTITSLPSAGTFWIGAFGVGLAIALASNLASGWRRTPAKS